MAHKPRLLSDNGSPYVAGDLWLDDSGMDHVRGTPNLAPPGDPFGLDLIVMSTEGCDLGCLPKAVRVNANETVSASI